MINNLSSPEQIIELINNQQLTLALSALEQLIKATPKNADLWSLQAIIYAKSNEWLKAKESLQQALAIEPGNPVFHNNLSNVYRKLQDLDSAKAHILQSLEIKPNKAETWNNYANILYTQALYAPAQESYSKAIRLGPGQVEPIINLANCCVKLNEPIRAVEHYKSALALQPDNLSVKQNLAMCYVSLKDYVAAKDLLAEAVEHNPQAAMLTYYYAESLLDTGDKDLALKMYERALELDASQHTWQHNLAVLYLRERNYPKAKLHFSAALKLEPNNPTAQHILRALGETNIASYDSSQYVSDLFDQYAFYYDKHVRENLEYQVPHLLRQAINLELEQAQINTTLNILDLGCGTGIAGIVFRDLAKVQVGVDLSKQMLYRALEQNAYEALIQANINLSLPGEGQKFFDIALAADVLVYLEDLEEIFINVANTLASQGLFAFTIELAPTDFKNTENSILQPSGRFAHNPTYIEDLSKRHNFNIKQQQTINLRKNANEYIQGILYILQI